MDEKNARVSAVFAEASAVEVYVSARVPALILPNQLQEALLLGESTRSEVGPGGASFLSIYAVGESRSSVTWSVRILNHACDDCVSFPNECVRKGSPRQRYVGDESGTSSGCDRVCTLQKRDRATLDSVEWLSLLGVDDLDGVYSGVMTPGTGLASKLKLKYNVSRFHTNYSLDLGDELAGNASCTAASRDPLKKSPELKACIEVNVLEDGGGADGAGTKSDIFRASIPVVLKVALKCPSGQFSENGLTPCKFCPKDQYQDESGAKGCKVCSLLPGRQLSTTLNTRGATTSDACVVCPEGAVCRLELPGACPAVVTPNAPAGGNETGIVVGCDKLSRAERDNMLAGKSRAWEFSQKNGDVTVYMTAKNGHKREERCGIEDDMYKGYSRVVFDPCPRRSSCLGAADQEGPIRKWTYSKSKFNLAEGPAVDAINETLSVPTHGYLTPFYALPDFDVPSLVDHLRNCTYGEKHGDFDKGTQHTKELNKLLVERNFQEGCAPGYTGARCLGCGEDRAKWSGRDAQCSKCPDPGLIIAGSIVGVIVATIATIGLIRWALDNQGKREERTLLVEVMKIAYNHLQLLSIMMAFPIKVTVGETDYVYEVASKEE